MNDVMFDVSTYPPLFTPTLFAGPDQWAWIDRVMDHLEGS